LFYWKAAAGDKIVLFEIINSSLATLTFVENTLRMMISIHK